MRWVSLKNYLSLIWHAQSTLSSVNNYRLIEIYSYMQIMEQKNYHSRRQWLLGKIWVYNFPIPWECYLRPRVHQPLRNVSPLPFLLVPGHPSCWTGFKQMTIDKCDRWLNDEKQRLGISGTMKVWINIYIYIYIHIMDWKNF